MNNLKGEEKSIMKGEKEMAKCPQCGREYSTRIRIKTKELVCNKCGYIGEIPKIGKIKNEEKKEIK